MYLVLLILLVLALVGGLPGWGWHTYGYGPSGVLGLLLTAARTPLLPAQPLSALPPWIWLGGTIGAGALVCLVVLGQVLGALALDHFGVLGAQRPADPLRIGGALLVLAGAILVMRPWQEA